MGIFSSPKVAKPVRPPTTPTRAEARGQLAGAAPAGVSINPSLIATGGGAAGLVTRARTKKRTLIGGS